MITAVESRYPRVRINGCRKGRLCNNLSLSFPDLEPEDLTLDLVGIAYSAGSACNSGADEASHVLRAMGLDDRQARATVTSERGPLHDRR